MCRRLLFGILVIILGSSTQIYAQNVMENREQKEEIKHRFAYLGMDGEFIMDQKHPMTVNDKRNPSRILLSTSSEKGTITKMVFFQHSDDKKIWAECGYQYIGSRPDPYFFPETSKSSIWDIFEKVRDFSGKCDNFKFVISRSPHDMPVHMHIRYGDDVEELLNMSKDTSDNRFNPWWPEYLKVVN